MGGSRGNNAWSDSRDQSPAGPAGPAQEQHVPVRGFNAPEAKVALRRGVFASLMTVIWLNWA